MRLGCLLLTFLVLPLSGGAQQPIAFESTSKIDAAILTGELKLAWDHFTRELIATHAEGSDLEKLVLLDRGMELCLMMNFPYLADHLYMRAKDLGMLKLP